MSKAKIIIPIETEVDTDVIQIGNRTLTKLLSLIENNVRTCISDLSIQSQTDFPTYEDIDAPLHEILNILEGR